MYIFFAQKHSKDKKYEKKIVKEKGFESQMYVPTFPHKLFIVQAKDHVNALASTSSSLQINLELIPQTNQQTKTL